MATIPTDEEQLAAAMAMARFSPSLQERMKQIARGSKPLPQVRAELQKHLKGWRNELDNAMLVISFYRNGGLEE